MHQLFSVQQVQRFEAQLINDGTVTMQQLLLRASTACAAVIQKKIDRDKRIVIVTGKGHNGADGLMIAVHLKNAGYEVAVFCVYQMSELKGLTHQAYRFAQENNVNFIDELNLEDYDICIDAILGIGLKDSPLRQEIDSVIDRLNDWPGSVVSIDCPSGINADTGYVRDKAVIANLTITLLLRKRGLYTCDAYDFVGSIYYDDLGIGQIYSPADNTKACQLITVQTRDFIGQPPRMNVHKANFGRVLVIGGNNGMRGAVVMCALAAARAGCGHVTLLSQGASDIITRYPDFTSIKEDELQQVISSGKITTIVIGPGLGMDAWAERCLRLCLKQSNLPLVIDADALRIVGMKKLKLHANCIMTPHSGEAAAMLHMPTQEVNRNRFNACQQLYQQYNVKILLKGAGTLLMFGVNETYVVGQACPALAVAGTGDILAGIIASMIAQRGVIEEAVIESVLVHLQVGLKLQSISMGRGVLATDMLKMIAQVKNKRLNEQNEDKSSFPD